MIFAAVYKEMYEELSCPGLLGMEGDPPTTYQGQVGTYRACANPRGPTGTTFFIKRLVKYGSGRRVTLQPGTTSLHVNRPLEKLYC